MATVKEFLARINEIEGVAGCLLVRGDGSLIGQMVEDSEMLSSLLLLSGKYAQDIMVKAGFSYCRSLCFNRERGENFYMFTLNTYYLGVVQAPNSSTEKMTAKVNHLLSLVKNVGSKGRGSTAASTCARPSRRRATPSSTSMAIRQGSTTSSKSRMSSVSAPRLASRSPASFPAVSRDRSGCVRTNRGSDGVPPTLPTWRSVRGIRNVPPCRWPAWSPRSPTVEFATSRG